jgi:hypothetical protein
MVPVGCIVSKTDVARAIEAEIVGLVRDRIGPVPPTIEDAGVLGEIEARLQAAGAA